jgi:glycosidase
MKDAAQQMGLERALAVMMLASRTAVLLDYGQELGLDMAGGKAPLMQWTVTNLTRKPAPPVEEAAAKKGSEYKAFLPWVKPLPKDFFPPPIMPVVEESDKPTPAELEALPGFTAGDFDVALSAPNGATANVATETYEDGSLLNLYKQLIQLHHENATVRSGSMEVLNHDDQGAVVWVRRAPASSRTSSTVVAACNLSTRPLVLSGMAGVPVGALRSLLQPAPADLGKVAAGVLPFGKDGRSLREREAGSSLRSE